MATPILVQEENLGRMLQIFVNRLERPQSGWPQTRSPTDREFNEALCHYDCVEERAFPVHFVWHLQLLQIALAFDYVWAEQHYRLLY